MSDIFDDILNNDQPVPCKKKINTTNYDSQVLYTTGVDNQVTLLLDLPVSNFELNCLIGYMKKYSKSFQILQVLPFVVGDTELKKAVVKLYVDNKIDLTKYINPKSKVLAVGRSLYSITENDMFVKPDHFWDTVTMRTHFYYRDLDSEIYPVNAVATWLNKDNFENFFFKSQLQGADEFIVPEHNPIPLKYEVIEFEKLTEFFASHNPELVVLDTETSGLQFDTDLLGTIQISFEAYRGYFFDVPQDKFKKKIFISKFSKWLKGRKLVFHNGMFDIMFMLENGFKRSDIYYFADTMLMAHIWNEMQVKALKGLIWIFLPEYAGYDKEKDLYMKKYPKATFLDMPREMLVKYGSYDAILTFLLYHELNKEFAFMDETYPNTFNPEWGIQRLVNEIALPALDSYVLDMKANGIPINWELLQITSNEVVEIIKELKSKIYSHFGVSESSINLSSDEQLGLLIESKGWKITERGTKINEATGKGVPLTGNRILREWRKQGHDICNTIISLREYEQLYKTFLGAGDVEEQDYSGGLFDIFDMNEVEESDENESLDDKLEQTEEKGYVAYKRKNRITIHPSYKHMLQASTRSSCNQPNFQQLITAKHPKQCLLFRRNILPFNKDYLFMSADYSSLQMVAAAEMCAKLGIYGNMAKVIKEYNKDFHSKTASGILLNNRVSFEDFRKELKAGNKEYKELRQKSKSCFTENTDVLTNKGFVNIKDLIEKDSLTNKVDIWHNSDTKIIGEDGKEKEIYASIITDSDSIIQFTLCNNDTIEVSSDHIMIIEREGTEMEIEACMVQESDDIKEFLL